MNWEQYARLYTEWFGWSILPLGKDKRPSRKWAEYQDRQPTWDEIATWPQENLAVVTGKISGIVVVDCDSKADANWFWENVAQTTMIVQTRRGFHFVFNHPGIPIANWAKKPNRDNPIPADHYDIRGDGGYVAAPPSKHSEGEYTWRQKGIRRLPTFNPEWRPAPVASVYDDKAITDGEAYIATIHAVSGQGGHNATYRAACCLRAAGLSEMDAYRVLERWNKTNSEPPWSESELAHKIKSAFAGE